MLSFMAQDFFRQHPLIAFPIIALLIFFALFTVLTWRTLRRSSVELDAAARMPFDDSPEARDSHE
jgi:cbb3-type cytochrome oxidase subunit 3